jgi:rubrerythrin
VSDLFYLQDSRSYVGNDVLWWAKDGKDYTTDLRNARIYTREEAQAQHDSRETDIPWPKDYIDAKTRPAVDMQYIKRSEALGGSGIVLRKPARRTHYVNKCHECGRFLSDPQVFDDCPNCGADNRP